MKVCSALAGIALTATVIGIVAAGPAAASPTPMHCTWPMQSVNVGGVWACQDVPATGGHHHVPHQ